MPSKRPHTKTRHGCKTCRERRVRCDLQRPICGNCTKRKIECGYTKELQQPPLAEPHKGDGGPRPEHCLASHDVKLMHHYSTSTYLTLSDDDARHPVWQVEVPELAFKHEFLLYGLFALTAFHRSRLPSLTEGEKASLVALGRYYKQWGLSSYIPVLERSTDQNCHALFAFSLLLGSLCLAELQYDFSETNFDTMGFFSALVGISNLLSGCIAIADQHRPALRRGNLAPLLGSDLEAGKLEEFPEGLREALAKILEAAENASPDLPSADGQACLEALRRLGLLYPANGQPSCSRAALIAWPVFGGREFLELMHSRDPLALVCLACYGAILHRHRHVWFLEGLGSKLVKAVIEHVPQSATGYLAWAVESVAMPVGGGWKREED